MKNIKLLALIVFFFKLMLPFSFLEFQVISKKQILDYLELKVLLLKHKATIESILSMKRFKLASTKDRLESTIYIFKKEGGITQILVRIRKSDGLVSEIAWKESSLTLANLTHDAIKDGFVPISGNSHYFNPFQSTVLDVNFKLAESDSVPCILRSIQ